MALKETLREGHIVPFEVTKVTLSFSITDPYENHDHLASHDITIETKSNRISNFTKTISFQRLVLTSVGIGKKYIGVMNDEDVEEFKMLDGSSPLSFFTSLGIGDGEYPFISVGTKGRCRVDRITIYSDKNEFGFDYHYLDKDYSIIEWLPKELQTS